MGNFISEDGLVHYGNLIFRVEPHKFGDCGNCQCNQLLQTQDIGKKCTSPEYGQTWCQYLTGKASKLTLINGETVIEF